MVHPSHPDPLKWIDSYLPATACAGERPSAESSASLRPHGEPRSVHARYLVLCSLLI